VSRSSEFCRHNPLCCFSASVYCLFRYGLSAGTFGYALVHRDVASVIIFGLFNDIVSAEEIIKRRMRWEDDLF
jgi:hypothetical protein